MSLALRRFRLDGVGPPGARFDPISVDLTADDKPARAAVLFLENGGGKSVLLRLLFSVVLPGRRHTVGSVKLDGYVGSGDTAHVALEWETSQRPLVTGTLLEWRNRTRSGSTSNLLQLWYSFVPKAGVLTLDDLPTREEGRRLSRAGFRERLAAVSRENPQLELVIEDSPGKWAEHLLRSTPLDPEIFRYQRQMNADEADAESLFSGLKTDEDFVRFVVEAVHDPEQLDGFDQLLAEYALHLGRHGEMAVEARFCREAAAALRPLGAAAAALGEARAQGAAARQAADTLRAELATGIAAAEEQVQRWRDEAVTASRRADTLTADAKRVGDIAAELRRREAVFRHSAAKAAEEQASEAAAIAARVTAGWESVGTVIDLRRHDAELRQLQSAQEQSDHELEPLRRAMEDAAARYAGSLLAEADTFVSESTSAAEEAKEATDLAKGLVEGAASAERRSGEAASDGKSLRQRVAEVEEAVAAARADGTLGQSESVAEGSRWATQQREEARRALDTLQASRRALDTRQQELRDASADFHRQEARVEPKLAAARGELNDHQAAAAALIGHPRVQEIVPDATDAWVVADRVEQVLDGSVGAAEAAERTLRAAIDDIDARLERLGIDGLLPASEDVLRVREAVVSVDIGAATGWSWLAHNTDDDGRARILGTNPALAGGVIVSNPDRLVEAVEAVAAAGIETDSVVLLGTAAQLEEPGAGHAAPVRPALYDPRWTERTRKALEIERASLVDQQDAATAVLSVDVPLLGEVREFRRRCPPRRRDALIREIDDLDRKLAAVTTEIQRVESEALSISEELQQLSESEPSRFEDQKAAEERYRRLHSLADQQQLAEGWAQAALQADQLSDDLSVEARRLAGAADRQRDRAETTRGRASRAASDGESRRELALRVSAESRPPAEGERTVDLDGLYRATRQAYEAERAGKDLTPQIEQTELARDGCARRLGEMAPEVREEALALADVAGAEDTALRRERVAEARRHALECQRRLAQCHRDEGAASRTVQERTPKDRPRHAALDPDVEPADADSAARAAAEYQGRFVALTQDARQAQAEADERREQEKAAGTRAALLTTTIEVLPAEVDATDDEGESGPGRSVTFGPWAGSVEDAQESARTVRRRFDEALLAVTACDRSLASAAAQVRQVASDPTLVAVGGVRLALANEAVDSLAHRALDLAAELDAMGDSIEAELSETLRHRDGIVQRLATLVEGHLRQLKLLARLSTLPPGLGDWSGKPFVSVDFAQAAGGEITARLGPIVDAAAGDARKRNGVDLLLAGMRAAVLHQKGDTERTFTVRLLRPNRMMAFQRASIEELEREFSGGMKLTAAICTYCALAALRANSRSTGSLFGLDPGPLFLDNPLGKASADYLLDLQHALAEKLGVQLVHTTGVLDVEALATYERVVRLRNLADLRHNVRRLRVDDEVHLPGSGATIDAVGFTVRRATP